MGWTEAPTMAGARLILEVDLPVIPSANRLYRNMPRRGRVKTGEYRRFCRAAGMATLAAIHRRGLGKPRFECLARLRFELDVMGSWLTKAGEPRRVDIDNRIKAAQDAVLGALGLDDRHVWEVEARKVEGEPGALARLLVLL